MSEPIKVETKPRVEEDRPPLDLPHVFAQVDDIQSFLAREKANPDKDMSHKMESPNDGAISGT